MSVDCYIICSRGRCPNYQKIRLPAAKLGGVRNVNVCKPVEGVVNVRGVVCARSVSLAALAIAALTVLVEKN